jgi:hypothetical protein
MRLRRRTPATRRWRCSGAHSRLIAAKAALAARAIKRQSMRRGCFDPAGRPGARARAQVRLGARQGDAQHLRGRLAVHHLLPRLLPARGPGASAQGGAPPGPELAASPRRGAAAASSGRGRG